MRTMYLIYPEKRSVGEHEITEWAQDLWADSCLYQCAACGTVATPCDCVADRLPVVTDDNPRPGRLDECAAFLENAGVATFKR